MRCCRYQVPLLALSVFLATASIAQTKQYKFSPASEAFGREVNRVLVESMPRMKSRGMAKVRFIISMDGKPLQVRLVARAGDERINAAALQHIRAMQFPLPPANASANDRIFTVTYLYR